MKLAVLASVIVGASAFAPNSVSPTDREELDTVWSTTRSYHVQLYLLIIIYFNRYLARELP